MTVVTRLAQTKSDGTAICSTSSARSPECVGRANSNYCADRERHSSLSGRLSRGRRLPQGELSGTTCTISTQQHQALCAESTTPEPRCAGNVQSYCNGSSYVDCSTVRDRNQGVPIVRRQRPEHCGVPLTPERTTITLSWLVVPVLISKDHTPPRDLLPKARGRPRSGGRANDSSRTRASGLR